MTLDEFETTMLDQMLRRIEREKSDGDIAYFLALSFGLEYITKVTTAAVVACLQEDGRRSRYAIEYDLVRANSIGGWTESLAGALTGRAAAALAPEAHGISRQFTERVGATDWRYNATQCLHEAAAVLDVAPPLTQKVQLRQLLEIGVTVRNRTRAHGAPTSAKCARLCPLLEEALHLLITNLSLFNDVHWAYIRRQHSGTYKVVPLIGGLGPFEYLQENKSTSHPSGVYIHVSSLRRVPLVFFDEDADDIFVPNGNFRRGTFECLSYVTDTIRREDASFWMVPPTKLPPSETEGSHELGVRDNILTNLPGKNIGHVTRAALETRIAAELRTTDRHPIVSLTGPGGIGKTTAAIAAIEEISRDDPAPYDTVLWISARDIDLLDHGPKPVTPRAITQDQIAGVAARLMVEGNNRPADHRQVFQALLSNTSYGHTLVVLDNFETVEDPTDVFSWIDAYVRPPNKVLITTRIRDFTGDVPIEIGGMTNSEATSLIDVQGARLGIGDLLTTTYRERLVNESEGHPYVIKILLGQVAHERKARNPQRIIASADNLLRALFERTFQLLTPDAQRVFLLLSSWPVFVPEVAIEAITLRPGVDRIDIAKALEDLGEILPS